MELYNYWATDSSEALEHYGTPGMHWYQRRYQYEDGSLTPEGRLRYLKGDGSLTRAGKAELRRRNKILDVERGRRVREAEKATKRGEPVDMDYIRNLAKATSLDDTRFKEFEAQYNAKMANFKTEAEAYGMVLGPAGVFLTLRTSELSKDLSANKRFEKKYGVDKFTPSQKDAINTLSRTWP